MAVKMVVMEMHRGYIYVPDGKSVTYEEKLAIPGGMYMLDDQLILWMTKKLG
jgi:hypothetical protein